MSDMISEEDIIAQLNCWRKEVKALEAQINEGEAALKFIQGFRRPVADTPVTVSDMALEVLRQTYPDGLSKGDIVVAIREKFGREINGNTLSVTLSDRLGREMKKVKFTEDAWFFVPQK